ncbi:MAG: PilN domain-containing protein [Acidobacteria bacterium]|nr:PilN domain-containing protein [Acidobacteriota bacterium]MCL5287405.1 PilN domain-containing protein [Acidobacteriota bacterium]
MIRINLLGQKPPKKPSRAVPAGMAMTLVLLVGSLVVAGGVIWVVLNQKTKEIEAVSLRVKNLRQQIISLQSVEAQVKSLSAQKQVLDQQYMVLDQLSKNRTGGQELMESLAGTVVRTDAVWLTAMEKKGGTLTLEGTAGSINAVANFITELKRSGKFGKVEISESRQDERNPNVATFLFKLTAEFVTAQSSQPAAPAKS